MNLVVFAWGNPSRGDDAVGPWFADRLRHLAGSCLCLVEDFQLQVEHLLDCREGSLLLFIDARCDDGQDFHFREVNPVTSVSHTSHALAPAELLGHYQRVFGEQPPAAYELTVPGQQFDLGCDMSATTLACCQRAVCWLHPLLSEPEPGRWREYLADVAGCAGQQ